MPVNTGPYFVKITQITNFQKQSAEVNIMINKG